MSFFLHEQHYRDLSPAADQLVTICGAGALGANLAETLARMGLRRLRVIDRDRIAAHNLSTQPWMQQDVGAAKARTLAAMLYRGVGARVEPQQIELTTANAATLLRNSAVVVDAFDNPPARMAVAEATAGLDIPCLHLALGGHGDYSCGLWDAEYVLPHGIVGHDGCDYPLTRPLALLTAAAGAEVLLAFLLRGERRRFEFTLRDLQFR
ncbi:MAG: ThiF family adenylyltransferase [Oscillochloris sp.]|nr:ThiF family adenylyltransferase [Oscillochloris sp.]